MFVKLGIPLVIVSVLTPVDVYLASQNNHMLDGNTLVPIGLSAIVLATLAKIVWWLATKSRGIEELESRMAKLEARSKTIENELKILPTIASKIDAISKKG